MKTKFARVMLGCGAAALVLTGAALPPVQPSDPELVAAFEARFTTFDVPEQHWDALIEAGTLGVPVDAQSGTPPVSSEPFELDGLAGTIDRWPDGSFAAHLLEEGTHLTEGVMRPAGVSGCTHYSSAGGTSSTNCLVQEAVFNVTTSFMANYWRSSSRSEITKVWNANAFALGGSWTVVHLKRTKTVGYSNANPARAELVLNISFPFGNSRTWLQLNVGTTSVWTAKNY